MTASGRVEITNCDLELEIVDCDIKFRLGRPASAEPKKRKIGLLVEEKAAAYGRR